MKKTQIWRAVTLSMLAAVALGFSIWCFASGMLSSGLFLLGAMVLILLIALDGCWSLLCFSLINCKRWKQKCPREYCMFLQNAVHGFLWVVVLFFIAAAVIWR